MLQVNNVVKIAFVRIAKIGTKKRLIRNNYNTRDKGMHVQILIMRMKISINISTKKVMRISKCLIVWNFNNQTLLDHIDTDFVEKLSLVIYIVNYSSNKYASTYQISNFIFINKFMEHILRIFRFYKLFHFYF